MDSEKDKVIALLKKFKNQVGKRIKIVKLILFGSRAGDNAKEWSDVDILLVSYDFEGEKYFKRSPEFYQMWDYAYDIDILCLTQKELAKKENQIGIIRQAVKEGIEI